MNVFSKHQFESTKFLDLQKGEYNLGVVPNIIIDSYIHNLNFVDVLRQLVGRFEHKKKMESVLNELMIPYENDVDDYIEAHNWFVETYGTVEENPNAYAFYP
jgi:hypothetical protein